MVSKDVLAVPVHSFMDVAAQELHAALLMAQGKAVDADAAFAKATEAESALGYREPPYYIRPVSETRGDSLMRAKRYADAKKVYQAALMERPNSGFPLYGIAQADVAAGDQGAASADFAALLSAWKNADAALPQIAAAKAWVDQHSASTVAAGQAALKIIPGRRWGEPGSSVQIWCGCFTPGRRSLRRGRC